MERTRKQFVTVEYERERLEIDGPSIVVIHKHKGKARLEIRPYRNMPAVKKLLDDTPQQDL